MIRIYATGNRLEHSARSQVCGLLIVVSRLQEVDSAGSDEIDKAMFLRNSPAPGSSQFVPKRLRFANAGERIGKDCFDEFERFQRCSSIIFDPPRQIRAEFWMKYSDAFRGFCFSNFMSSHLVTCLIDLTP